MDLFDYFSIAAVIDGKVLCVHGGLSPEIRTLDQMRSIDRLQEIPHEGAFCDLLWSDPEDISEAWQISPRGAGELSERASHQRQGGREELPNTNLTPPLRSPRFARLSSLPGYLFGDKVTSEFCSVNGLSLIARAHQLVMEGRKFMFNDQLVTVWSAPNYCYRCGNVASILTLSETLERSFKYFSETENSMHGGAKGEERNGLVPYFL